MILDEAKELLSANNISFELREFQNEAEYWYHTTLFPYTKNAKPCKVIAIIIRSKNGKKDIELQFNAVDDILRFEELRFGDYCYEKFDVPEEMLAEDLMDQIFEVLRDDCAVIVVNDLKKKRRLADACFSRNYDDAFEEPGIQKAMQRIKKPQGFFSKLLKSKKQYEIYDWNTYQCIVK